MNLKNRIESALYFLLITALPVFKVFLLGEFDAEAQSQYIRVYFWLQFLVPVVDFGYYWAAVRGEVSANRSVESYRSFSCFGLVLAFLFLFVDPFFTCLFLLVTITAWYNFRLQIFRINGSTKVYYCMRLSKVALDALFVCVLFLFSVLTVEMLLLVEFLSIFVIAFGLAVKEGFGFKLSFFVFGKILSFDYLYCILSVSRSSLVRLLLPFVFFGEGVENVLFVVLFYELVAQYLSIEKLKDLLSGKVKVLSFVVFYFCSLPVQYFGIGILADIMVWEFGVLEVVCVVIGGSAKIFSVYTLKAIKNNGFDLLVWLNVFIVVFGVVEIFSFQQFVADGAAQLALLTFYGVEALFSVSVVFWFERSKLLKSK
jgi:hypothetical protein